MNTRIFAAALAFAAGIGVAGSAGAVDFSVYPVRVELGQGQQTAVLNLSNGNAQPLRLQVRAFVWSMDADGKWQLAPTDDLIVNPQLFEIGPNQVGQLRVGTLLSPGQTERAYRLLLDELPGSDEDAGKTKVHVRVLTRLNLPVFLEPAGGGSPSLQITHARIRRGQLVLSLRNVGNERLDPQPLQVDIRNEQGHVLFHAAPTASYLLSGAQLELKITTPAQVCAAAAAISVNTGTTKTAEVSAHVDDRSCASIADSSPAH
ncbi:MAG TPA: fimbria/pilus periplasmic chaperone [Rhodanobacteraceae bacterium]|nr:fimbria/pilus periplasmic chaperone [Rhodanobacteraceae bacterium]